MANKKTQRDYFGEIIALAKQCERADLVEFAEGRIAALDKKTGSKKPTKTQVANEGVKDTILTAIQTVGKPATVTEIIGTGLFDEGTSNQKITALMRQLVEEGAVVKTYDKKKALFSVAEEVPEETEEAETSAE